VTDKRWVAFAAAVASPLCLLTGPALADHVEPAKASKAQFALVNAFFPCEFPNNNTTVQTSGGAACTPAAPQDGCALTATGSGKVALTVTGSAAKGTQALKVAASAKGLNALCESSQLCLTLSLRETSDDCPEGSCTAEDFPDFEPFGACCTVVGGACKITTSLNATALILANAKNTGLELLGCGLHRSPPPSGPPALSCGILFK
jgi:hypothetical protein